jgi:hypothetical protein
MFRFSRDKRFLLSVSLSDFLRTSRNLAQVVQAERPGASVLVLTCEDPTTHAYSQVTFAADEVTDALQQRREYSLDELTKDVWDRSLSIQVGIKDANDPGSFMICVSCDKHSDGGRIAFYGQCVNNALSDLIHQMFARSNFVFSIGDGYPKHSGFNLKFGERITGISLS